MVFPFNYAFLPSTRGADGDPLGWWARWLTKSRRRNIFFVEFDDYRLAHVEFFFATYHRLGGKDFKVPGLGQVAKTGQILRNGKLNHHKNG
jgi:inorganic pyrophosphatase